MNASKFLPLVLTAALAGCGGAAGTTATTTTPNVPAQTLAVPLSSSSQNVQLPSMNGYGGSMSMPSGSGAVTITMSAQPPSGIPALSVGTALEYITITASGAPASMSGMPGLSMTMSSMQMNGSVYMAQYINGAWTTVEGPASMSGSTANMAMMTSSGMSSALQAGESLYFAVYSGSVMP